jgi:hypothetical protein
MKSGKTKSGGAGRTSAPADPILLQTAQKSRARPLGVCCAGEASSTTGLSELANAAEETRTLEK